MTYAKIIADSIYDGGPRLTTFEVQFHRFVLAEVNTHRTFSRNSASSRAIPVAKQIYKVEHAPAVPVVFPAEQKGMQGGDEISDPDEAKRAWLNAADDAVISARRLVAENVHKSVVNRLLEPFQMHTAVITATAYDNFFMLRCDPLAQPELRVAAEMMKEAYDASTPEVLTEGMWHLPYITDEDREYAAFKRPDRVLGESAHLWLRPISSARCARVSYETQAGVRDYTEDQRLYTTLTTNGHASPLEHVATPDPTNQHTVRVDARAESGPSMHYLDLTLPKYGNLLGYHQHRFDVEAARGYQSFA